MRPTSHLFTTLIRTHHDSDSSKMKKGGEPPFPNIRHEKRLTTSRLPPLLPSAASQPDSCCRSCSARTPYSYPYPRKHQHMDVGCHLHALLTPSARRSPFSPYRAGDVGRCDSSTSPE